MQKRESNRAERSSVGVAVRVSVLGCVRARVSVCNGI
jgi:hypothetical protein